VCHIQYKLERGFSEWAFGNHHPPSAVVWTAQSQKSDSFRAVEGLLDNSIEIVLPMGVDPSRFGVRAASGSELRNSLGFTPNNVVLGIACAFRRRKRVEDFIRLVSVLRAEFPEIRGVIAGGPVSDEIDYSSELHTIIDREDLKKHVLFVGDLVDIEPVHQAIDISVSTSEYETFGMSVCEAMACGKPTIGYAGGSVREVIGIEDCIAETGDFPRLLSIARRLVGDANMRERYGLLARRRVEQEFNPIKTFEVLRALYSQIS
jgi:glycosyltransferase involved in cell wall biosynthesis